ncbi:hypothetical protein [Aquisphaera insulae]|uniref:hypothetical protein n=1 Tax=Aquisphaera insulae TaxID=2712864 RepID=UPI0013EA3360|nr:hypothetical protein [Aquisphaera insulae]
MPEPGPDSNGRDGFNLRPRTRSGPFHKDSARFHVFLVDTGWNTPVSKVLHEQVHLFHRYHPQDPLFILTREQSISLLKHAPDHIGLDPMVIMYDMYRPTHPTKTQANYHGFRLNLGVFKNPQQAAAKLQEFLKFVARNREAECLSDEVARELHREGMTNMVKLLREASEASLELL